MLTVHDLRSPLFGPVSLTVTGGACVAVMGPSGAGKSLLLRAIADLDPTTGSVTLDGVDRDRLPAPEWRRRVALVPAESGWWTDLVGDHFTRGAPDRGLLDALGLPEAALGWPVARLSSGERHRLAIARALCAAPAALLLDEPTASLDATATARVEAVLRQRLAAGAAVLLVTHEAAQAGRLATRTLRLRDGVPDTGTVR